MNFKAPYNLDDYVDFFQSYFLPEDFESCKEKIEINFQTHFIENITKLGEVPSLDLSVYEAKHQSENDPRVSLSRDSFRFLAQYGVKRALILFISKNSSNYRLSFVTIDLKWKEGKRVKKEYSNPRRYSFFLGPDTKTHTPEEYLIKLGRIKDFDDLKKRFSIEVVNKEFYTNIAILFTKLAGGKRTIGREQYDEKGLLKLPSTNDDTIKKEFSVRLIGRLVFCWFLKKKHSENGISLLSEHLLSLEAVSKNKGYYHKILEPLFFGVLNTPINDRRKEYRNGLWSKIPFLNGGLFIPHLHDFFDPGSLGMSKHINTLQIPDEWVTELFGIFETYNFTIDENTSMDVELAIEPEMLGRIFENLLAEINPETGETARKVTGSYYTPRPIVEYMVDESLKQYLLTTTKLHEDKISSLLAYEREQVDLTDSEKDSVLDALDKIKIIDPACGSGAFPMGILQKMLLILQKIDPESKNWLSKKIAQIDNKLLKKELEKKLKQENWDYVHKLGIIQSSIYGVDIQPIAVDISKLRFFLSLIVDEKVDDAKENRGIEPLPNLEFKFVCANSLIGLPKKAAQQTMFEATDDIDLLKNLRDEYLRSYGKEKERVEKKFKETQSRMFRHSLSWGGKDSQTLKLSQWDPFSFESCGWFDPEWMFGVKSGFDIAIGNPPYVDSEHMAKYMPDQREIISNIYSTAKGNWDLYIPFWELAFNLLSVDGCASYITPNKWLAIKYGEKLRALFKKQILKMSNCDDVNVFDAGNSPVIVLVKKGPQNNKIIIDRFSKNYIISDSNVVNRSMLDFDNWGILLSLHIRLLVKIFNNEKKISDYCKAENPFTVSEAYDFKKILIDLQKMHTSNTNKYFRFVNTGTIDKYICRWGNTHTTYLKKKYLYPVVEKKLFLEKFPARYKQMACEKIVISGMRHFESILDKKGYLIAGKSTIILKCNDNIDISVILGVLNSNIISFYIKEAYRVLGINGGINFTADVVESLPVPDLQRKPLDNIRRHVSKILDISASKDYFRNQDKQREITKHMSEIDKIVYTLYSLNETETNVVEDYFN